MNIRDFNIKNKVASFPEKSHLIIREILEKYGLAEIQEREIEKFFEIADPGEKMRIFNSLPGVKISELVKEYAEGKISLNEIPSQVANRLNIPEVKARQIANDLEKSILSLVIPLKKQLKTPGEILLGRKPSP